LSDDEQRAWRAYLAMQSRLATELNRRLQATSGLSLSDYAVLVELSEAEAASLRPSEIGRDLQWEQSRLSHQLTRMERRGLLHRTECPGDRRGALIGLSEAGREALAQAAPEHAESVRSLVFDGLTSEDLAVVERFAGAVLGRLGS